MEYLCHSEILPQTLAVGSTHIEAVALLEVIETPLLKSMNCSLVPSVRWYRIEGSNCQSDFARSNR
jgi:hypothetical protein